MSGDNKIECENCESRQDSMMGTKLKSLPPVLTLSLSRFEFDYEILDRVKIFDVFKFPLELDLSDRLSPEDAKDLLPDALRYELAAVLIHRGNAHGGHYHAYIRDVMKEG